MSRRKASHANHTEREPAMFRLVVRRRDAVLVDRTMLLPRDPVGGLPMARPLAHDLAARFDAPVPTTAYALGMDEVVWRCGDGPQALWITFTAV